MFNRRKAVSNEPGQERNALAAEMLLVLRRHVMDAWFPVCIDEEHGGFHSAFDRKWRRIGSTDQMLEFQARQTRACADLAIAFPNEGKWQEYALHGLQNLRERMWDSEHGGWFWRISADGTPLEGATKHAHGSAYAVQAAAQVFRATGSRNAIEHAEAGLDWFATHAHDAEFGGFHSWLTREGAVIRTPAQIPPGSGPLDPLGHDVGLKDANVHGDWFETLLDLTVVSESSQAKSLLEEFGRIYLDRVTTSTGAVHYAFSEDWTPQPGLEWHGYGFQATERFLFASQRLPSFAAMEDRARVLMLHTVRRSRMKNGGFCYAGPAAEPTWLEAADMRVRARTWWVQFEALRILTLYAAREETPGPYLRAVREQWEFIKSNVVDEREGGTYHRPLADWRPWVRSGMPRQGWAFGKGDHWKDASHETDCLLMSIRTLDAAALPPA